MVKYKVIRKSIRWNRQTFVEGDLLPDEFTERDMYRVLYPSRIKPVEVPDEVPEQIENKAVTPVKEVAAKPTGAPISGVTKSVKVSK